MPTGGSATHDTTGLPEVVITYTLPASNPVGGGTATPELGSGELLATGLLPLGLAFALRRRRARYATQEPTLES